MNGSQLFLAAIFLFFLFLFGYWVSAITKKGGKNAGQLERPCESCGKNAPPVGQNVCRECEDALDEKRRSDFDDGF